MVLAFPMNDEGSPEERVGMKLLHFASGLAQGFGPVLPGLEVTIETGHVVGGFFGGDLP